MTGKRSQNGEPWHPLPAEAPGTTFTCFTSTKVQILTWMRRLQVHYTSGGSLRWLGRGARMEKIGSGWHAGLAPLSPIYVFLRLQHESSYYYICVSYYYICVLSLIPLYVSSCSYTTQGRRRPHRFLPQLDEIYFTTAEKTILENCICIVPNFIND